MHCKCKQFHTYVLPTTNKNSWWTKQSQRDYGSVWLLFISLKYLYKLKICVDTIDEWRQNIDIKCTELSLSA